MKTRADHVWSAVRVPLLGGTVIALLTLSPPLREAVIALEPSCATLLFLAGGLGALARWRARRDAARRRAFRLREARWGRTLARWGWAGAIVVMLAPLLAHWAQQPPGGTTALAALFGHLPWSDAIGHFEGGVRLLTEGVFGAYSERRPLNAAWLAVRLAAGGGSLPFALTTQAILLGLAAYLLARVVALRFGLWTALACFGLVQGLTRDGIPTAATEPLGITLGCVALVLLLVRQSAERPTAFALALFALDVALNARPGPQFLVPAVALSGLLVFRVRWRQTLALLLLAVVASALTTRSLNALYGAGEASFTTYPAYTLYGLTRDSNYKQAQHDYGDEIATLGSEREVARFLYRKSFEAMRREPQLFVAALVRNELKFFDKLTANLARLVTLETFGATPAQRARPDVDERIRNLILGLPLLVGAVAATLVWLRRTRDREARRLLLLAAAGVVGSAPFVYGDAGFRGLAASYPFLALGLSVGFGRKRRLTGAAAAASQGTLARWSAALTLSVVVLSLSVPALAHRLWPRPDPALLAGATPGATLVTRLEAAPAVLVARVPRAGLRRIPWLREHERDALLDLAEMKEQADLRRLELPFALISAFDSVSRRQLLLVGPVDLLRRRGYVRLDVEPLGGSGRIVRALAPDSPRQRRPRGEPVSTPAAGDAHGPPDE